MYRFYLTHWPRDLTKLGLSDSRSVGERGEELGEVMEGVIVGMEGGEARHARKVLRLSDGDRVEVFDGWGHVGEGVLVGESEVRIDRVWQVPALVPRLTVASAVPKGPGANAMVDQLGQLGVSRLIPMSLARSVVHPRAAKVERWARATVETAKQCGRAWLMIIEPMMTLDRVLEIAEDPGVVCLMGRPGERGEVLPSDLRAAREVLVLIGPEGGWTDEEIAQAEEVGVKAWTFGPHVLRIETAAVAAAAIVRGEVGLG